MIRFYSDVIRKRLVVLATQADLPSEVEWPKGVEFTWRGYTFQEDWAELGLFRAIALWLIYTLGIETQKTPLLNIQFVGRVIADGVEAPHAPKGCPITWSYVIDEEGDAFALPHHCFHGAEGLILLPEVVHLGSVGEVMPFVTSTMLRERAAGEGDPEYGNAGERTPYGASYEVLIWRKMLIQALENKLLDDDGTCPYVPEEIKDELMLNLGEDHPKLTDLGELSAVRAWRKDLVAVMKAELRTYGLHTELDKTEPVRGQAPTFHSTEPVAVLIDRSDNHTLSEYAQTEAINRADTIPPEDFPEQERVPESLTIMPELDALEDPPTQGTIVPCDTEYREGSTLVSLDDVEDPATADSASP